MKIYKYALKFEYQNSALGKLAVWDNEQTLDLPVGANPLSAQFQNGALCLWAEVNENETETEKIHFEIVGTGHPLSDSIKRHLGTVQDGNLVFHIFEVYKGINKEDILESIEK